MSGVVFDAGALIGYERGDRRVVTIVQLAREAGDALFVPAGVVGQVWRDRRRQARLATLLKSRSVKVEALDASAARRVGQLLGMTGTVDIVDASVVLSARRHGLGVVTSDPDDLKQLDPKVTLTVV